MSAHPVPVLPDDARGRLERLRRLEQAENFPVALRILPRPLRADLRAVYDVARFVDDVGDDPSVPPATRREMLDVVAADVRAAFAGQQPQLDVLRRLAPVAAGRRLPAQPFLDLVEANRIDQVQARYPSYDDLRDYCALSADPVGRVVLALFGVTDGTAAGLSDDVCTALQILEHCQDVGEDLRLRDRLYLPVEDLHRFGVTEADLLAETASAHVRRLVAFEVDRAAQLLAGGDALLARLHGWSRIAVIGYVAGGLATVDALRDAAFDVLAATPRPRRRRVLWHAARLAGRVR